MIGRERVLLSSFNFVQVESEHFPTTRELQNNIAMAKNRLNSILGNIGLATNEYTLPAEEELKHASLGNQLFQSDDVSHLSHGSKFSQAAGEPRALRSKGAATQNDGLPADFCSHEKHMIENLHNHSRDLARTSRYEQGGVVSL
jgi:hypothetical protein